MNEIALSRKMKRLAAWRDERCQPESLIRKQFEGAAFGNSHVTINPDRQGPFASFNLNRVCAVGSRGESGLDAITRRFKFPQH